MKPIKRVIENMEGKHNSHIINNMLKETKHKETIKNIWEDSTGRNKAISKKSNIYVSGYSPGISYSETDKYYYTPSDAKSFNRKYRKSKKQNI